MSEKVWINKMEYEKFIVELKEPIIRKTFEITTKELKDYFEDIRINGENKDKELHIKNFKTDYNYISKEFDKIKKEIRNNFDEQEKTDFYNSHNKRSIYNVLDEIKEFFGGTCILEMGKLYTVKRNVNLWGLGKNIILDGSGTLNYVYSLQKDKIKFKLNKDYQVLDHKNFTIEHIEINTTKTSKEKYLNFYQICRDILKELGKEQTLVVCAKYEHQNSKNEEITDYFKTPFINHCQNFVGSNMYENLKNILIVDTFNISEKDYILEYLYYSNAKLEDDKQIEVKTKNKHRNFENAEIENYKNRRIANEFYQSIKRINRKLKYDSRVVIITQHTEAVMLACEMLKNCNYMNTTDEYKKYLRYDGTKTQTSNNKIRNNDIKAIEILTSVLNNGNKDIISKIEDGKIIIKKQTLRNLLGIKYASNFRREVLSKANVKDFLNNNEIEETNNYFKIPIKDKE